MKTFSLSLACYNCGTQADYQIPIRKVFYDYRPEDTLGMFGIEQEREWSRYETPKGNLINYLSCDNCKVAMLVRVPTQIMIPPPGGQHAPSVA